MVAHNRRAMQRGDIVVLDYPNLNAIGIVTDMSTDENITNNISNEQNPAYRIDYIIGVSVIGKDVQPAIGFIWLNDNDEYISIVGVNGYTLPEEFYGVDVKQMFKDLGAKVD